MMDDLELDLESFFEIHENFTPPAPKEVVSTTPIPLLKFPNEIILLIADHLDAESLSSIILTNRRLAGVVTPLLHNLACQDKDGLPALVWALSKGFDDLARLLIERGVGINAQNPIDGNTPLHVAAKDPVKEIVKLLLDKGADVNIRADGGLTTLHAAAAGGDVEIVKLLLDKGVDANTPTLDSYEEIAMNWVLRMVEFYDWEDEQHGEVVRLLLKVEGVDVNFQNRDGDTAIKWAARGGYNEICRRLLEKGADPDVRDDSGRAPLHWAAMYGRTEIVRILLDAGADVLALEGADPLGVRGVTSLHWAALEGYDGTVWLLLERGAEKGIVHVQDPTGATALHWATDRWGNKESIQLLLDYGADVHVKTNDGLNALDNFAMRCEHDEAVVILLRSHMER